MDKLLNNHYFYLNMPKLLLSVSPIAAALGAFFQARYFPNGILIIALSIVIILDFITAIIKAYNLNLVMGSWKWERSVFKAIKYLSAICLGCIIRIVCVEVGHVNYEVASFFLNSFMIIMLWIQTLSVWENIYLADTKDKFAKYIAKKMICYMTFTIKDNPLLKFLDKTKKDIPTRK